MNVEFTDNSAEFMAAFHEAVAKALERCGETAEKHAKTYAPVDTGKLKEDIAHVVADDESAVYIGSTRDVPYAKYQELGTYKMPAHPFLKPAVANHAGEYRKIIEEEMKNA